jgi:hypothetical protein
VTGCHFPKALFLTLSNTLLLLAVVVAAQMQPVAAALADTGAL